MTHSQTSNAAHTGPRLIEAMEPHTRSRGARGRRAQELTPGARINAHLSLRQKAGAATIQHCRTRAGTTSREGHIYVRAQHNAARAPLTHQAQPFSDTSTATHRAARSASA